MPRGDSFRRYNGSEKHREAVRKSNRERTITDSTRKKIGESVHKACQDRKEPKIIIF